MSGIKTVEITVVLFCFVFSKSSKLSSTLHNNNHLSSDILQRILIQGIKKARGLSQWPCSHKHEELIRARKRYCQSPLFKVVAFGDVIRSCTGSGEADVFSEPMCFPQGAWETVWLDSSKIFLKHGSSEWFLEEISLQNNVYIYTQNWLRAYLYIKVTSKTE